MNCPVDHFIPEDKCWVCVQVERDKIILALLEALKKGEKIINEIEVKMDNHGINFPEAMDWWSYVAKPAIAQAEERP